MKLLTQEIKAKLLANREWPEAERKPVVKFFYPAGSATWLISELDDDGDTAFGLCDLGMGSPELGNVSIAELQTIKGRFGLGIERDIHWKPCKTLAEYADEARAKGHINA